MEGEIRVKISINLGCLEYMVIETQIEISITSLRIQPKATKGLLISETLDVVTSHPNGLKGGAMEEGLKTNGAIDHHATLAIRAG